MYWPQYTYLTLVAIGIIGILVKATNTKSGVAAAGMITGHMLGVAGIAFILYQGGFFHQIK